MHKIIQARNIWFTVSGIFLGVSILSLLLWGLKPGIDFTGGSLLEVSYSAQRPSVDQVNASLTDLGLKSLRVQPSGDQNFILRFEETSEATHQSILQNLGAIKIDGVDNNSLTELSFESIGPVIGKELTKKSIKAIILVLIFIILYIAYAFRKVSKPIASWKYGVAAVIALIHDILIITGIFSLWGHFGKAEVDTLFVTALLTILGFSVHDTIVTFDRIRENLAKIHDKDFADLANISINQTIVRSINTSLTTLLALSAVVFFGGTSIRTFALTLIMGIIVGTYSSIYIASALLVTWEKRSHK